MEHIEGLGGILRFDGSEADVDQKPIFVDPELGAPFSLHGSTTPESTFSASTRRSSADSRVSKASSASSPPPAPPPSKRRRTRKGKTRSKAAEEGEKRTKFLERNRVAASKCRQKKKEYVAGLEETKADLETLNSHLTIERGELLEELARIKNHLMLHAHCADPSINNWLMSEARQFIQTTSSRPDPVLPPPIKTEDGNMVDEVMGYPDLPFLDLDLEPENGDNSFSQSTSLQTSPTELMFPMLDAELDDKIESEINYDHMPDSMFV